MFAIPGIGRLTVDAILRRDYPIIQGVILLFSTIYVLVNLAVDLSYRFFDPRIQYRCLRSHPALPTPARVAGRRAGAQQGVIYRHPTAVIGGVVLVLLIVMALLAPYLRNRRPAGDLAGTAPAQAVGDLLVWNRHVGTGRLQPRRVRCAHFVGHRPVGRHPGDDDRTCDRSSSLASFAGSTPWSCALWTV